MRLLVRLLLIWCGFYLLADTPSGWAQVWPNRPASFVTALDCPFNSKPTPSRDAAGCNGNKTFYWFSKTTSGFTINGSSSGSDACDWWITR